MVCGLYSNYFIISNIKKGIKLDNFTLFTSNPGHFEKHLTIVDPEGNILHNEERRIVW